MILFHNNLLILTYFTALTMSTDPNVVKDVVLEVNEENDLKMLNDLENFITIMKKIFPRNARRYKDDTMKFSDFIVNAIDVFQTYSDEDLEDVVFILNDEIRNCKGEGCRIREIIPNEDVRRYLDNTLSTVHNKNGFEIKQILEKVLKTLQEEDNREIQSELLDYINSLYGKESEDKFKKLLMDIRAYKTKTKRAEFSLLNIIRNGLRSIFIDPYAKLKMNDKTNLRLKINDYLRNFIDLDRNPNKSHSNLAEEFVEFSLNTLSDNNEVWLAFASKVLPLILDYFETILEEWEMEKNFAGGRYT